ncbi:putative circadian clock protein, KaiC [Methanoregula boonei 6A8]|jgi:KaiC domain protein|uniref:Putative circadian clock protein, KaiC n=1 Tax=Methanoregula boonei (strain DSM 21154 / JCM 14090 / 6A8) TaxID=456442 RepID=A7IAW0_METB6|nr:KaiC domain-containing protein [Methanoregula boonei]ABS56871.1 putative circadian clock protein, KaiC [Methanoregula boonei 6A8]
MNSDRVKMGIPGLDEMLGGGLLAGNICAVIGTYGTGKTTFSLNFIWDGLKRGERAIYISLEEREDRLLQYMKQKGWDVEPYLNKSLFIIKLDPTDFNLANNRIKNELPNLISEVKASRVVIDPISLFEDLFSSDAERRREMFRFIDGLREKNCTMMMTSETNSDNVFSSRHGLIEYLADTVILLRYVRSSDLTDVYLALEVVKMRMSSHSREIKPYAIEQTQVTVFSEANVF